MSKRVAILARRDHPEGWGFPGNKAHGWVVVLVACENDEESKALVNHIHASLPVVGIFGSEWWDTWYGGTFDLVAWVSPDVTMEMIGVPARGHGPQSASVGDNRYVGVVYASELFGAWQASNAGSAPKEE